jgi:rRNA processing protein Gar1
MAELVTVLHKAKSGRLILKPKKKLTTGMILIDKKGRRVGKVVELIGPVISPYASAIIFNEDAQAYEGLKLYSEGES